MEEKDKTNKFKEANHLGLYRLTIQVSLREERVGLEGRARCQGSGTSMFLTMRRWKGIGVRTYHPLLDARGER